MASPSKPSNLRVAAFIALSTYINTALGFAVSVVIARSLGPHDYGQYAYLVWLSGFLVTIGNHGLSSCGIRFISECHGRGDHEQARHVHHWLRKQQLLSVAITALLFTASTYFVKPKGWEESTYLLVGVVLVSLLSKAIYIFDVSIAKGYKDFAVESWITIVMSVAYIGGALVMAWVDADLSAYALFFGFLSLCYAFMSGYMLRRRGIVNQLQPLPPDLLARIKNHLFWTVVLVFVVTLSNKTLETFLLSTEVGMAEVGYFSIAAALSRGGIELLSSALNTMLMPMMGHAYGEGGMAKVNQILSDSLRYFTFLGLLLAGLGTLWADAGVSIMYGVEYRAVVDVLRVMMLVGGLTLSEGVFGSLLTTTDNQKLRAQVSVGSVVISAVAAFSLVPTYGLVGALVSYSVTRISIVVLMAWTIRANLKVTWPMSELIAVFGAALLGGLLVGPLVWMFPGAWGQFAAGILYVLAYVWLTVKFKFWTANDANQLQPIIRRLPTPVRKLMS